MNYQVIARKWRPQTFSDVVGQEHVMRTLANALRENRVAHAYIFSGARGVGKTTTARILAKALNCVKGPTAEPCNECDSCLEITAGNSLDVIEIDAASNRGIDQVRELRDMVRYAAAGGRYKVIILDEAHMLTTEASNALLKTLEEPPEKVVFVMATTQAEDLADTIRSRSQHFHFRALSFKEIDEALAGIAMKEALTVEPGALAVMARAADGSLRDGMSLLEQARAYSGTTITEAQVRELLGVVSSEVLDELIAAIEARSAERVFALVHKMLAEGQNLHQFCREAIGYFRNLLMVRVCGADSELVAAPADERPRLARAAAAFSEEDLTRFFEILLITENDLRHKPDPRLHLEMGLLRLVNAARLAPLEEMLAEFSGGGTPRAERPASSKLSPAGLSSAGAGSNAATGASTIKSETPISAVPAAKAATAAAAPIARSDERAAATGVSAAPQPSYTPKASASGSVSTLSTERLSSAPAPMPTTTPAVPAVSATAAAPAPTSGTSPSPTEGPVPGTVPSMVAQSAESFDGLDAAQVMAIKAAVLSEKKFLGELVDQASRWEMEGSEIRLYFPTERSAIADLLQTREPMEKLRTIANRVLGRQLRVCVKLEAGPVLSSTVRAGHTARELRMRFEQDPIVRAMLERFGGKLSDVKLRGEE